MQFVQRTSITICNTISTKIILKIFRESKIQKLVLYWPIVIFILFISIKIHLITYIHTYGKYLLHYYTYIIWNNNIDISKELQTYFYNKRKKNNFSINHWCFFPFLYFSYYPEYAFRINEMPQIENLPRIVSDFYCNVTIAVISAKIGFQKENL